MHVCDMFVDRVLRIHSPYIQYCLSLEIGIPSACASSVLAMSKCTVPAPVPGGASNLWLNIVQNHQLGWPPPKKKKNCSNGTPPKSFHYKLDILKKIFRMSLFSYKRSHVIDFFASKSTHLEIPHQTWHRLITCR